MISYRNRGAVGDSSFTFLCSVLWAAGIDSHCLLSLCLKWSYPELDYSFCCGSYDYSFISCLANDFLLYIYILKNFCVFECLPACMCVHYMHACYLWRPEERERDLWNWSYRLLWATVLVLETKPGSLQEQPVILSAASSLAPVNRSIATMIHWVLPVAVFTVRWQKYIWGQQQTAAGNSIAQKAACPFTGWWSHISSSGSLLAVSSHSCHWPAAREALWKQALLALLTYLHSSSLNIWVCHECLNGCTITSTSVKLSIKWKFPYH